MTSPKAPSTKADVSGMFFFADAMLSGQRGVQQHHDHEADPVYLVDRLRIRGAGLHRLIA
ncbi:hypothetical protein [Polaromonas sp.]|uniref:hypothetical protein n=1 Tax=Polaromonas sp. TaxID=1869339 RepID=UPI0013BD3608|nr:hypothetical protein [Polaromonas sp.]NDP61864.1 hypothetical protein [Polaromonas sp.]